MTIILNTVLVQQIDSYSRLIAGYTIKN